MTLLEHKKELILKRELAFANAIGSAVVEKPRVSFWMIMIPILFLYFIYRMQKYKAGLRRFEEEFMTTRQRALDLSHESIEMDKAPDIERIIRQAGLTDTLAKHYEAWVQALVAYYMDLLAADGDSFASLVGSAYHSRSNYLLTLNQIGRVEKEFYRALKPQLETVEGAVEIIATIETLSHQLRCELAGQIFP